MTTPRAYSPARIGLVPRSVRAALAALMLVAACALAGAVPAAAQSPAQKAMQKAAAGAKAPTPVDGTSSAELEALAKTLRNDAERARFLDTLDGLIAARRAAERKVAARPPALADRVAGAIADRVAALGERFGAVLSVLRDVPRLAAWVEDQLTAGAKRDRLIGIIWRFIVIVGVGMAAQFGFRRLTDPYRRRLETEADGESMLARAVRFALRTVMLFANALAYGAGAYGAYFVLPMTGAAGAVLLVGASSFFVAKLILATARVLLSPGVEGLRLGTMSDETANYLYIWVRRLVRIFVYTFFFLEAMRIVGLPGPAHESLLYLTGLALAGFVVVFVMQNRHTVAAAIRGREADSVYGGVRARLAATWHLFAILYIAAVYLVWLFQVEGGFEFLMAATGWSALILIAAKLVLLGAGRVIDRAFRVSPEIARRFPGIETRANRYLPVFNGIFRWLVYIIAVALVLNAWGVATIGWITSTQGTIVIAKLVTIAVILLVALVVWEALNLVIARYLDRLDGDDVSKSAARARTLLPLIRTTILVVLSLMVALIVLSELGVNIGPLLAGAGVIGLAVGFGSQKLVQDVITGLFILIEDTLAVGDVVRFDGDHAGVVEALSVRSVRLRDLSGNVHTLPFSEVKTVLNMTKDWSSYVFDVGVAYRENVDHVIDVLKSVGEEMQKDAEFGQYMLEPLEVMGLDKFADSALIIKARIKVQPPIKQWYVGREFNRRIKARFDAEGIEIPFPHQTIYFGEDRQGHAPPVHVAMEREDQRAAPTGAAPVVPRARPSQEADD